MINPFHNKEEVLSLALSIVNTIPDPFLVMDKECRVLAASRSFYDTFNVDVQQTRGQLLYSLGDGQWDIPALRVLLETIIPRHTEMDAFEVEHDFPHLGRRIMLLNARQLLSAVGTKSTILLAFRDITAHRAIEREKEELLLKTENLLSQKRLLFQELQHRVGNSLQIVASLLLLKARTVSPSSETRGHLNDAYERVMSIASVQSHLNESEGIDAIEVGGFLSKLCESLAKSMSDKESQPLAVKLISDEGMIASSDAVSIGLIVTELVINAVKHAFPVGMTNALIRVSYEIEGSSWKLTICDNGVGKTTKIGRLGSGLGTMIVNALVRQLGATLDLTSGEAGVSVSIKSQIFEALLPRAA